MASLKVDVISRDIIKPSSPTPSHLNTVQLSLIDQFAPSIYIPLMFFYRYELTHEPIVHNLERSVLLKRSLADTLVRFYPLAGRVRGNISIECNDEGVEFYDANVSNKLCEVIEKPNLEDLRALLPVEPVGDDKSVVLGVQVNHFSCGGIVISVCISHKIADGKALVDFVRAWADTARGVQGDGDDIVVRTPPKFDGASYFPPRDFNIANASIREEKIVTRRLVFDKEMINALKEQVSKNLDEITLREKAPTRVEVISAFLWNHFMESTRRANDPCLNMMFSATHAVNLRNRRSHTIPEDSFGNFWWFTTAPSVLGESDNTLSELASKLREAIRKIDDNFIGMLEGNNNEFLSKMKGANVGTQERCGFSSWCRFPLYEVNFGWGVPTWVCTTTLPFKNVVILLSTKSGDGIEAWVNMLEDDVSMLEQDLELLSSH